MLKITGQRGAAGLEPENTMRSFRKAVSLGADYIEFDIRRTKDNQLVVFHDDTLERTTGASGYVKDHTFKELKKLDAGKGEKILSLQKLISHLKDEKLLMTIEIKEPETLNQILSMIKANNIIDKIILVSFWHETIKKAKEIEPEIKTGAIIKGRPIDTVSMVKACNAGILCMNYVYIDKKLSMDAARTI